MFQRDILLNWQLWRSTSVWVWILMVCHTAHLDTSVLNSAGQMCNYQALWLETDVYWTLILTWERDSVTEWKKGPLLSEVLLLAPSYLSVLPSILTNSPPPPHGNIFVTFYIWDGLENLTRKFSFGWNLRKFTDTLRGDVCAFLIISRWILLRIRKFSEKVCKKIGPTFDIFMHEYDCISLGRVILGERNRSNVSEPCPPVTRRILLKFRKL
jgi:hypothetical protein